MKVLSRDPRIGRSPLEGARLISTDAHGKNLLLRFDNDFTMHSHLRMTGTWRIGRRPDRARNERHVCLKFERTTLWGVNLPVLSVLPTKDEVRLLNHLGPDLIRASWNSEDFLKRLSGYRHLHLGHALLSQGLAAGFGNLYAVEIPFICGLSPLLPMAELVDPSIVWQVGRSVMRANAILGPQSTTGRRAFRLSHWVYGKGGRACSLCSLKVVGVQEQNSPWKRSYWLCEGCQPISCRKTSLERVDRLLKFHRVAYRLWKDDENVLSQVKGLSRRVKLSLLL